MDVKLGDDGPHRRQVGLELHVDRLVLDRPVAVGAVGQGDVADAIDVVRWRPVGRGVALRPSRLLGTAVALAAAEGSGLAVLATLEFIELLAQGLELLLQVSDLGFQSLDAAVALTATGASRRCDTATHRLDNLGAKQLRGTPYPTRR